MVHFLNGFLIYSLPTLFLFLLAQFFYFRNKIARANKTVEEWKKTAEEKLKIIEDRDKVIEEKLKIIEEKDKIIAEKKKIIVETEILAVKGQKEKVELLAAQFEVQNNLEEENKKYNDEQQNFANSINQLAKCCSEKQDGSKFRNQALKILTSCVIYSFCKYVEKAKIGYQHDSSATITSFFLSEIIPFFDELNDCIKTLNDENILHVCTSSTMPLKITCASMGAIDRCFIELLPRLDPNHKKIIFDKLSTLNVYQYLPIISKDLKISS